MSTAADESRIPVPGVRTGRTRYWVLPKLQARFVGWLVAISAVVATTVAWTVLLVVWSPLGTQLAWTGGNVDPDKLFWDATLRVVLTTGLLVAIFAMVALLTGLVMSHKVAGPLHRMTMVAGQVSQGQYRQRVELRRGDYIQDFADKFNGMLDHVQGRIEQQQVVLTNLQLKLAELDNAAADGKVKPEELEARIQEILQIMRDARMGDIVDDSSYT